MFALSKYWTWDELCDRWGLEKIEIFDFLKKGLQIYTDMGDPEHCPGKFHRHRILMAKQHYILKPSQIYKYLPDDSENNILPNHTTEDQQEAESKALEFVSKEQREKFLKIKNEMLTIHEDDPGHVLWKYFEMPESYGDRRNLLKKYEDGLFKREEITAFEKIHNLKPIQTGQKADKSLKTKKPRPSRIHRELCRKIAAEIWAEDSTITIADMCKRSEIKAVAKNKSGKPYAERTIRGWISDLCPDRSPGRRPQKDK